MRWLFQRFIKPVFQRPVHPEFKPDYSRFLLLADQSAAICNDEVSDYFRRRLKPVVFHDHQAMIRLVDSGVQLYPVWRQRLQNKVRRDSTLNYSIYGLSCGPLLGDDPWDQGDVGPGSDLQYRKKLHRFSFVPGMVLESVYEPAHVSNLLKMLQDWTVFAAGPKGQVCFDSNLAVIQRLMASTWAWVYGYALEAESRRQLDDLLLAIIANDICFLRDRLGDSYANNHLLADHFAAWFIALLFPEFTGDGFDIDDCEARWVDELIRQTYPDGGSFEPSVHYHEFACEMSIAYMLLSERNQRQVPERAKQRIKQLLWFQAVIGGVEGEAYPLGDCIEDNFFPLGVNVGLSPALSREAYRYFFDSTIESSDLQLPAVECAYWLLGGLADSTQTEADEEPASATGFKQMGLHVFEHPEKTMQLLFRTGPAASVDVCAGHAHADFLSVTVKCHGIPMMVDAGTYSYRAKPEKWPENEPLWRHYFRGPEAHNCVVWKGLDPLGACMKDFRPRTTSARVETDWVSANPALTWVAGALARVPQLCGYTRGVVHVPGCYSVIYDLLPDAQAPDWAGFQCSPDTEVHTSDGVFSVSHAQGGRLFLSPSDDFANHVVLRGSINPLGGWVSPGYGILKSAPQIRLGYRDHSSQSAVLLGMMGEGKPVIKMRAEEGLIVFEIEDKCVCDQLLLGMDKTAVHHCHQAVKFDAGAVWVRRKQGALVQIRALDISSIAIPGWGSVTFKSRQQWVIIDVHMGDPTIRLASGSDIDAEFRSI